MHFSKINGWNYVLGTVKEPASNVEAAEVDVEYGNDEQTASEYEMTDAPKAAADKKKTSKKNKDKNSDDELVTKAAEDGGDGGGNDIGNLENAEDEPVSSASFGQ